VAFQSGSERLDLKKASQKPGRGNR